MKIRETRIARAGAGGSLGTAVVAKTPAVKEGVVKYAKVVKDAGVKPE